MQLREVLPAAGAEADWAVPFSIDVPAGTWSVIRTTPERSHWLMRILVGSADARAGEVTMLESHVAAWTRAVRRRLLATVGVVLAPPGLASAFTLLENVASPSVFRGRTVRRPAESEAEELLERFGVGAYAGRRPPDVPEDARQLAALARALMGPPALLLLENPLAAVKSRAAAAVWAQCRRIVPSALITTFRRDETLYALSDALYLWDSSGLRRAAAETSA